MRENSEADVAKRLQERALPPRLAIPPRSVRALGRLSRGLQPCRVAMDNEGPRYLQHGHSKLHAR